MAEKRYYWLKLKNTYFKQLSQVKMRQQKHGKDMQIIYLKMMLYSLENQGEICYEGVFGSLAEEIALKIDEESEIVEETLDFLKDNGMITVLSNDLESIVIPETVNCTGSEAYSTERSRRCRDKKRCNATDTQQGAAQCNQEKEKDIEKDNNSISKDMLSQKKRCNATDTQQGATQCNQEKEKDIEKDNNSISKDMLSQKKRCNATDTQQSATQRNQGKKCEAVPYQQIIDMYNTICKSFPHAMKLSEARKKAIRARYSGYSIEDFRKLFEMAEESSFLKGSNDRNWKASFDWLIKDANMLKVLEGNYADAEPGKGGKSQMQSKKNYQQFAQRECSKDEMDELEKKLLQKANSNPKT